MTLNKDVAYRQGQHVQFRYPIDPKEAGLIFEVLEVRDTRILVREVIHAGIRPQTIQPTFVYLASDLQPIYISQ